MSIKIIFLSAAGNEFYVFVFLSANVKSITNLFPSLFLLMIAGLFIRIRTAAIIIIAAIVDRIRAQLSSSDRDHQ